MKMASTRGVLLCVFFLKKKSDFFVLQICDSKKEFTVEVYFENDLCRFKMYSSLIINNAWNCVNNIGLVLALLDSWLLTGLNKRTTFEKLMEVFSQFGEIIQGSFMLILSQFRPFPLILSVDFRVLGSRKKKAILWTNIKHPVIEMFYDISAGVATDRVSGFSKGFGFVRYATIDEAEQGIKGMDDQVNLWIFTSYACNALNSASISLRNSF